MKLLKKSLPIVILIALVSGFAYFALTDVEIAQTEVSKEIPNEQLFDR